MSRDLAATARTSLTERLLTGASAISHPDARVVLPNVADAKNLMREAAAALADLEQQLETARASLEADYTWKAQWEHECVRADDEKAARVRAEEALRQAFDALEAVEHCIEGTVSDAAIDLVNAATARIRALAAAGADTPPDEDTA